MAKDDFRSEGRFSLEDRVVPRHPFLTGQRFYDAFALHSGREGEEKNVCGVLTGHPTRWHPESFENCNCIDRAMHDGLPREWWKSGGVKRRLARLRRIDAGGSGSYEY